jgi:hypothetical protein
MKFSMIIVLSSTLLFSCTPLAYAQKVASPPAPTPTPSPAPAPSPPYVNLTDLLSVAGPFHNFLNYLESTKVIDTKPTTLMKALPSSYQKMMPSKISRRLLCQT